jgi:DNA-binding NarL/FixJ family response regulator
MIEELAPDVAVVDCELPEVAGTEVAREIRRQESATQVLALSSYDDEHYVRGMLDAGAVGYLLKEEAPQTIVAAVRTAA